MIESHMQFRDKNAEEAHRQGNVNLVLEDGIRVKAIKLCKDNISLRDLEDYQMNWLSMDRQSISCYISNVPKDDLWKRSTTRVVRSLLP